MNATNYCIVTLCELLAVDWISGFWYRFFRWALSLDEHIEGSADGMSKGKISGVG